MLIDTNFNFYSDARGGDPDSTSPTLRRYHQLLWSKPLPNGKLFELNNNIKGAYLYHQSELGEYILGSDAISHSYKNQKRKQWLVQQIPNEVDEVFDTGSTIGAYIVFPKRGQNRGQTINQERGINSFIDDRFDLTLECIRRFYLDQKSPLYNTFNRYKNFFDLFDSFDGYVKFFLLEDLICEKGEIKFYLPFDDFKTRPIFSGIPDYLTYKEGVLNFIRSRNERIENYIKYK